MFPEIETALIDKFSKEDDRQLAMCEFNKELIWVPAHVMEDFQRISRILTVGLPGIDEASREKLLKDRIIKSAQPIMQEKLWLAAVMGMKSAIELVTLAQFSGPEDTVRTVTKENNPVLKNLREELKETKSQLADMQVSRME